MAYNEAGFVRLPPDSTGKRSAAAPRLIIRCDSYDPSVNRLDRETTITGSLSGATAKIVGIHTEGLAAGEVELYCNLDSLTGTFIQGDDIRIGATTYATIAADADLEQIYYQKSVIVDRDDLDRTMRIGEYGDVYTRFDEGSPALSSFGGLVVEAPETSRQYVYAYDEKSGEFYDVETGAATITYLSDERAILLDTNGTSSGDKVTRQSHLYHPYQPGTMSKIMQTLALGDTGKANVRRRWGYFDENDGLFWELDGTTLYVVVRSSTTGSPVDTRVAQASWNGDSLDGTENFNLDVSKTNLYWIDFQWLGVGICRFGVYADNGAKITAHTIENPNNQVTAYMKTGTLPVRYEIENTDTAGSSSEMKAICCVVQIVGKIKRQFTTFGSSCASTQSVTYGEGEKVLMTIRSKELLNGLINHAITTPSEIHIVSDPATSSGLYNIRLRGLSFTQGGTWQTQSSTSATEYNCGVTGFLGGAPASSGTVQYAAPVKGGDDYDHRFNNFDETAQYSILTTTLSDQTTRPEIAITVEAITPGASGDFFSAINYDEMVY